MIFWVLVCIIVVICVWLIWEQEYELVFLPLVVGGVAVGLVALLGSAVPPSEVHKTRTETYDLQALSTRESSAGYRYFLSPGYNNGQPGFNYIREDGRDGQYVMRFAQNNQAVVHTDEEDQPYVDVTYYNGYNPFWVMWATRTDMWHVDLHVPENSISSEISVNP